MPYASRTDLETRFGAAELAQLADRDGDGVEDAGVIDGALADADQLVNGYVAGRYAVPLSPVPDLVKRWACDIARYFLWADAVTDLVKARYEAAVNGLKDVARGAVTLQAAGIEARDAEQATADFTVLVDAPAPVFTDAALEGF